MYSRLTFRLRTLLVVVAVSGAILIPLVINVRRTQRQEEAVSWVLSVGGSVTYEGQPTLVHGETLSNLADFQAKTAQEVGLSGMTIRDIGPLRHLTSLQRVVIGFRRIRRWGEVRWATASSTRIADLTPLAALRELEELYIFDPQVRDLSPLRQLRRLRLISLNTTSVSDIEPLSQLSNLQEVYLHRTQVNDLSPLANLRNLRILSVSSGRANDLSPLRWNRSIEHLSITNAAVEDLSPLTQMTSLRFLSLVDTKVCDLSALAYLSNLVELHISGTRVRDLSPLCGLTKLRYLYISGLKIETDTLVRLRKSLPNCRVR